MMPLRGKSKNRSLGKYMHPTVAKAWRFGKMHAHFAGASPVSDRLIKR